MFRVKYAHLVNRHCVVRFEVHVRVLVRFPNKRIEFRNFCVNTEAIGQSN